LDFGEYCDGDYRESRYHGGIENGRPHGYGFIDGMDMIGHGYFYRGYLRLGQLIYSEDVGAMIVEEGIFASNPDGFYPQLITGEVTKYAEQKRLVLGAFPKYKSISVSSVGKDYVNSHSKKMASEKFIKTAVPKNESARSPTKIFEV